MNRITRFIPRQRRFHILWALAFAVLFGSTLAEALLDLLVPRAAAQGNVVISSTFPTVFFDDSDTVGVDWQTNGDALFYLISDPRFGTTPLQIDMSSNNNFSFVSDPQGNVGLANGRLKVIRATGFTGVGTTIPLAPLHVLRTDGSAQVLVEETTVAVSPRNMFELRNNGPVGFNMFNTDTNQRWRFAAQVDGFRINIADAGDLGPEMIVFVDGSVQMGKNQTQQFFLDTAGNLTIQGTLTEASDVNAKEDFVDLEGAQVLAKLSALPVTEWSFKGDPVRHIGPTAQDFHAAFGLGGDDKHIAPKDVASVALVGVKELHTMIAVRDAEIAALKQRLAALEGMVSRVVAQQATQTAQR